VEVSWNKIVKSQEFLKEFFDDQRVVGEIVAYELEKFERVRREFDIKLGTCWGRRFGNAGRQ
jgi:hypothetical protein